MTTLTPEEITALVDRLVEEADLLAAYHALAETLYADIVAAGGSVDQHHDRVVALETESVGRMLSWVCQMRERLASIPDGDPSFDFWQAACRTAQEMLSDWIVGMTVCSP